MITIDGDRVIVTENGERQDLPIGSPEAFNIISDVWLRSGWDTKYVYSFTWLGQPIIQLPEDMFRVQEVIYALKPDVILETGIAHGGSLIFYASLCKAMGHGRVIGVDVEIRPHNRVAIESHDLFGYITLLEGNSVDEAVVEHVKSLIEPNEKVFVSLDSNHSKQHVLAELEAYSPLVSVGSYIIAADGIMARLAGAPRSKPDWRENNPMAAAREFVGRCDNFVIEPPPFLFNEGVVQKMVTYWLDGWIKRIG